MLRRRSAQDLALAWHLADFAVALIGLLGHLVLRRLYARQLREARRR